MAMVQRNDLRASAAMSGIVTGCPHDPVHAKTAACHAVAPEHIFFWPGENREAFLLRARPQLSSAFRIRQQCRTSAGIPDSDRMTCWMMVAAHEGEKGLAAQAGWIQPDLHEHTGPHSEASHRSIISRGSLRNLNRCRLTQARAARNSFNAYNGRCPNASLYSSILRPGSTPISLRMRTAMHLSQKSL